MKKRGCAWWITWPFSIVIVLMLILLARNFSDKPIGTASSRMPSSVVSHGSTIMPITASPSFASGSRQPLATDQAGDRAGESANVLGRVLSQTDVVVDRSTPQPQSPLEGVLVLAIPADQAKAVFKDVKDFVDPVSVRHLQASIGSASFTNTVADAALVGSDGSYALNVSPANYLLCLANIDSSSRFQTSSASIVGCANITVLMDKPLAHDLLWTAGEVILR